MNPFANKLFDNHNDNRSSKQLSFKPEPIQFGKSEFFNPNPSKPNTSKSPYKNNKPSQDINIEMELKKRDQKIENLELEVKTLKNTLNICMLLVQQLKMEKSNNNNLFSSNNNATQFLAPRQSIKNNLSKLCQNFHEQKCNLVFNGQNDYKLNICKTEDAQKANYMQIYNQNGKIRFIEPVNTTKITKKVHEMACIANNNISVFEDQLQYKKCQLTLNNFDNYSTSLLQQKQKIVAKISSLSMMNKFSNIKFDYETGKLTLDCSGF